MNEGKLFRNCFKNEGIIQQYILEKGEGPGIEWRKNVGQV